MSCSAWLCLGLLVHRRCGGGVAFSRIPLVTSGEHGVHDLHVASTSTQVSREVILNLLRRRVLNAGEQADCGHHETASAVRALKCGFVKERLLNGMKLTVLRESFHSRDLATLRHPRQLQEGAYRLTFHQHRACTAHADATS